MKLIIRKRLKYNEKQELSLEEFKTKFKNKLTSAIQTYSHSQKRKDMLKPLFMTINTDYTLDFYRDLRWNFNHNVQSEWYIDKIQ